MSEIRIRPAIPGDEVEIVAMVRELAEFERAADLAIATAQQFHTALFCENPTVFAHIAQTQSGDIAGFALWFRNFSTWQGKHGIYLEDLYVRPQFRGSGIGQALMAELAALCETEGYPRFEWWVLDWNESARNVYHHLGAEALTEWVPYRVSGNALSQLAHRAVPT
jgi:GNAT superfamily N-acetyltransferase